MDFGGPFSARMEPGGCFSCDVQQIRQIVFWSRIELMELTGGNIRKGMITCSPRRKFYLGMDPLVQRFERI